MGDDRAKYLTAGSAPTMAKPAFALTEDELTAVVRKAVGQVLGEPRELLVDKQGLARCLNCSAAHIDVLRKRGLPTVPVGQLVRFEPAAVLAWLRKQTESNDA